MEPYSPRTGARRVAGRARPILASLPERDPDEFLRRPPLSPPLADAATEGRRPLVLNIIAYVLLEVAGVVAFGILLIALIVVAVTMLNEFTP